MNSPTFLAELKAIRVFESNTKTDSDDRQAVLAALGSKFLAVGTPHSVGIHVDLPFSLYEKYHRAVFPDLVECRHIDSVEELLSCEVACLPNSTSFSLSWIPEASHLNIVCSWPMSKDAEELAGACRLVQELPRSAQLPHGDSLQSVIDGTSCGREGSEITALFHV